jgi:hypothetical protein
VSEPLGSPLAAWEGFYVIVGSSAGALTGLQFVVIALITDLRQRPTSETLDAFGTPTIVHFCIALLTSATLSAPWPKLNGAAAVISVTGLAAVAYEVLVAVRTRRQSSYQPVFEDWLWHVALPFAAYGTMLLAGLIFLLHITTALFMCAAATLLLLFIGIHNAWDTVTYIATTPGLRADTEQNEAKTPSAPAEPAAE